MKSYRIFGRVCFWPEASPNMGKLGVGIRIEFGVSINQMDPFREVVEIDWAAEENQFDYFWTGDAIISRELWVTLGALAVGTKRIRIGPACAIPYLRHPGIIALAAATLDELSRGRAVLGIGPGSPINLAPLSKTWENPVEACRETIQLCRRLFAGESVKYDGSVFKLDELKLPFSTRKDIKIYLAARSPKMLEMAAEVADGIMLSPAPSSYVRSVVEEIRRVARIAGRDPDSIDISQFNYCAVEEDPSLAKE
jgi:5,10-methylenetetrahydromethanopterin reductase